MQSLFQNNPTLWKLSVCVGFLLCGIFIINEIFLTQNNLMSWMIKTMNTGVVHYDELFQKSYLLVVIPAIFTLEQIRKRAF